jgi:hypothetical protein
MKSAIQRSADIASSRLHLWLLIFAKSRSFESLSVILGREILGEARWRMAPTPFIEQNGALNCEYTAHLESVSFDFVISFPSFPYRRNCAQTTFRTDIQD